MIFLKIVVSFTTFLLAAEAARADILFIDLNNGPGEIAAAQRAAQKRGEKLIIYKGTPNQTQTDLEEDLTRKLSELKGQKVSLSSVVVSGHDGNGHFFGLNGEISSESLNQSFKKSEMGDNVRSLMLWGCYTGTPGALEQHWKKAMPNVNMVAGFEGSAPANTQAASANLLQDALEKEKMLSQLKDENAVQKALKQLKGGQITTSALCVGDKWASNTDKFDIEKRKQECTGKFLEDPKIQRYDCYLKGKPECQNVPKDTQSGEMRQIYNFLQSNSICDEVLRAQSRNFPSRDTALRLIFFENIRRNFAQAHTRELDLWAKAQEKMKMPANIRLTKEDMVNLSRAELLSRLQKQKEFIAQKQGEDGGFRYNNWQRYTRQVESLMTDGLRRLPSSWVEPNTTSMRRYLPPPPQVPSEHYEPRPEEDVNPPPPAPDLPPNPRPMNNEVDRDALRDLIERDRDRAEPVQGPTGR